MKAILVVVIIHVNGTPVQPLNHIAVEFDDMPACNMAADTIARAFASPAGDRDIAFSIGCFPKASKRARP